MTARAMDRKEQLRKILKKKEKLNTSALFLLPILGLSGRELFPLGFENCYLSDKNRPKVNDKDIHIYLLFRPESESQRIELQSRIDKMEEMDNEKSIILDDYDYDGGFIVLVLKFPEEFRKDYNTFLKSKYTQFSTEFKNRMPKETGAEFINSMGEIEKVAGDSLQWMIITKNPMLRRYVEGKYNGIDLSDAPQIWPAVDIDGKEVLDIDQIMKNEF